MRHPIHLDDRASRSAPRRLLARPPPSRITVAALPRRHERHHPPRLGMRPHAFLQSLRLARARPHRPRRHRRRSLDDALDARRGRVPSTYLGPTLRKRAAVRREHGHRRTLERCGVRDARGGAKRGERDRARGGIRRRLGRRDGTRVWIF